MSRYLILLLFSLFFFGPALSPVAAAELNFFSDSFAFIGQDENGYTLFNLNSSRGLDKGTYRAEHQGALYDQYRGWINLVGIGEYQNSGQELQTIPDSPMFRFANTLAGGLTIRSRANDLTLSINPLAIRMREERNNIQQEWGSTSAVLSWQGRNIPGRVIYKRLGYRIWHQKGDILGAGNNFQGFALAVQSGAAATWQDIYLQSEEIRKRQRTKGFIDAGRRQASLIAPDLKVTDKSWALGFYRWNKAWQMNLQQTQADGKVFPSFAHLELKQVSRTNLGNWVTGGVALSVVEGTIKVKSQQIPVLGFAEQIR